MKILFINNLYAPYLVGGAERILQTIAEAMVRRNHEVTVLTTGPDPGLREDNLNGVRVLRASTRNLYMHPSIGTRPPAWKRMLWHIVDFYNPFMKGVVSNVLHLVQPNVVNLHNITGFSSSVWDTVRRAGLPMVQVLHDQYLLCPRSVMFRDKRLCKQQCMSCRAMRFVHPRLSINVNAVVGVSKFILEHHLRHGYFQASTVKTVIHNAQANSFGFSAASRKPDGILRFGFIGNLGQHKGIELLLKAFQEAARPNWQLHIAGSGYIDYVTHLREHFAAPNVVFRGTQNQEEFYPSVDLLVVPSLCNESLASVVFEAMSYGLPVIGSRLGGIPEIIKDRLNGLLFDPSCQGSLRAVMCEMADDVHLRSSMALSARSSARYFHDMDRFLSGYEDLFRDLCRSHATSQV